MRPVRRLDTFQFGFLLGVGGAGSLEGHCVNAYMRDQGDSRRTQRFEQISVIIRGVEAASGTAYFLEVYVYV